MCNLFSHELGSQIVSQQVCPQEVVENYTRHFSPQDFGGTDLLYWGYKQEPNGLSEFVYLLVDERFQRPKHTLRDDGFYLCVQPYYLLDDLECLILSQSGVRRESFADVCDTVVEPVLPGPPDIETMDYFGLTLKETAGGYYWKGEPQYVRNLIDFLSFFPDSEIFYRMPIGNNQPGDWRKGKIKEFKKTGFYLSYDDISGTICRLAEYALPRQSVSLSNLPPDLEWVRDSYQDYSRLGLEVYGKFWDDEQIETYISKREYVVNLLRYTILSLFQRRFEFFPKDCPDNVFGEKLLDELMGKSILVKFPSDFSRDGASYRLKLQAIDQSVQCLIQYSAGKWELLRVD
jgi:hypothetical protein